MRRFLFLSLVHSLLSVTGDLHSVKIMWPRNAEERARNRHTGFVCFVNRADAEDAMEACAEADPFNVGRRLFMRWGKNVKNIVKPGTVGPSILQKKKRAPMKGPHNNNDTMAGGVHSPAHALDAERAVRRDDTATIRVVVPRDPRRAHFISTVASFVATDGSQLESMLMDREYNNPDFDFLHYHPARGDDPEWLRIQQEHIFYKWRVYSFCQEDSGYHNWREQPFTMFAGGCTWIPPPRDTQAALREQEEVRRREEAIAREKEQRRFHSAKRGFLTGRQLENQKRNKKVDGGSILTAEDRRELDRLFRQQLCLSRGSICEAMAFCFEKSAAAKIISSELKDMLSERGADVKTMVSRLYLLSDILFNSQQPGVRNAFLYRDAIQQMASDVFASLGLYAGNESSLGRMSRGRLSTAVHSVLAAWTNWGVFDHVFLDELQARFEGREIVAEKISVEEPNTQETEEKVKENPSSRNQTTCVVSKPRGDWTDVTHDVRDNNRADKVSSERKKEPEDTNEFDPDGIPLDEEEGEGDPDGIPVDDSELTHDAQGQDIPTSTAPHRLTMEMEAMRDENDPDGEPLEGDDPDGEPLDHADGEPLDGDCDGELLY
jgi:U2-associated protein SR140